MGLLAVILCGTIAVQVVTPLVASRFIDRATTGGALGELIFLALLTMGLALAGQGMAVAETYVAENVSWAATNALRADLLAHLLRLDATFHTAHTPGELIERADGDVATLARFFSRFVVSILGNGVLIVGVLGLLAYVDWRVRPAAPRAPARRYRLRIDPAQLPSHGFDISLRPLPTRRRS